MLRNVMLVEAWRSVMVNKPDASEKQLDNVTKLDRLRKTQFTNLALNFLLINE